MVVITSDSREVILDAVRAMYTQLANRPDDAFHFATGRRACEYVGYSAAELDPLPASAVESFAGVAHPFRARVVGPGDVVLDVGSGSGTDALIASGLVGSSGRVLCLDMTRAMREKLKANAARAGAENVRTVEGNAEAIPIPDGCATVVTSNGVLNLVPDKQRAITEIYRVLAPGGRIQISDIVVELPPSEACRAKPQLWAECIVGATTLEQYHMMFHSAGFSDIEVVQVVDYFAASPSEETRKVAASFGAHAVVLKGTKPA